MMNEDARGSRLSAWRAFWTRSRTGLRTIGQWLGRARPWITVAVAFVGVLIGTSEYVRAIEGNRRQVARERYSQVVGALGSESLVIRVGAIGQVPDILAIAVPEDRNGHLWDGMLQLLGFKRDAVETPYHDDLLRVIGALTVSPKDTNSTQAMESDALISMLCAIGPEGWYRGAAQHDHPRREACLSWIWQDAPEGRISDRPAYNLFRRAWLSHADLGRFELQRAEFSEAHLFDVSFSDSDVTGAHFDRARMREVSFRNAKMATTSLVGASLDSCDLSGAMLRSVSFVGADLRNSDFRGATFDSVSLRGADVTGADFRTAVVLEVDLRGVRNLRAAVGWKNLCDGVREEAACNIDPEDTE